MKLSAKEVLFFDEAILLAKKAEAQGNLPIGAVIVLDGKIISQGANSIWKPQLELTRHAEMEALKGVSQDLWSRSRDMHLFTTLEPCVMCAGAILLHQLGKVMFGSSDPWGGFSTCLSSLPHYFKEQLAFTDWRGPAYSSACDLLYKRIVELEER